jgi:hypothetical protein
VFYFTPHKKWYLIFQMTDKTRQPPYFPAFATTTTLADPDSWSKPVALVTAKPSGAKAWLDFWVIAADQHAYLFFTSLDGKMWRMQTRLVDFPSGWGAAEVALTGDVFEASHTYRLKGTNQYLTLIEAQKSAPGWRYYKAFLADRLDGAWRELPAFASLANVKDRGAHWTDSFSHGELLRAGVDEKLEVDPAHLRLLIQGVLDCDKAGKPYGQIPWRLGLLESKP